MKMLKSLMLAAMIAVTPACATIGGVVGDTPIAGATAIDDKAMYAAEALYNVPAQAYVSLDSRGKLPDGVKRTVHPLLVTAYDVLLAARQAKAVGDVAGFNARVASLRSLKAQIESLLPSG